MRDLKFLTQNGSLSLSFIASISSGLFFTLLFLNLGRYIVVENALEQATEKVARCITPTDPKCINYSAPSTNASYDWYLNSKSITETSWINRYNYSASITKQNWELNYPTYEIHKVKHPLISWNEWKVPEKTFYPYLNAHEYRNLIINANIKIPGERTNEKFVPMAEPNFPEFDPVYEREMRDRNIASWHTRALNTRADARYGSYNIDLPMQPAVEFSSRLIKKNSAEEFITDYFEVPELGNEFNDAICSFSNGGNCDLSYASGNNRNIFNYVSIAIKAFATVISSKNNSKTPTIKWAGAPGTKNGVSPDGWGLAIDILSKAEYQNWKQKKAQAIANNQSLPPAPSGRRECLGGRDWEDVTSTKNFKSFHLVLRGAIKRKASNNALDIDRDPACPNGDVEHWNLFTERGGAYRIVGWLTAKSGDISSNVRFEHYIDSYKKISGAYKEPQYINCQGTIKLKPNLSIGTCPYKEVCTQVPTNHQLLSCSTQQKTEAICLTTEQASSDSFAFFIGEASCGNYTKAVVCNDSWKPNYPANCDLNNIQAYPNRISCGWKENPNQKSLVQLGSIPNSCPLATKVNQTQDCANNISEVIFKSDNNYGIPATCPQAINISNYLSKKTKEINSRQPSSSIIFPESNIDFSWTKAEEFIPAKWEANLYPFDNNNNLLSGADVIRTIEQTKVSPNLIYKHQDKNWKPDYSNFNLAPEHLSYLQNQNLLKLNLKSEEDVEINNIYPFQKKPEFEIPNFLATKENLLSCTGVEESIEKRLRYYASQSFPILTNEDIFLKTDFSFVDTTAAKSLGNCESKNNFELNLPQCSKTSYTETTNVSCNNPSYLGRFDALNYPAGPESCLSADCFRINSDLTFVEQKINFDIDQLAAAANGYKEVERMLSGSKRNCKDMDCSEIAIENKDDQITISANYHMPLNFPLNTFLGKNEILIEKTKVVLNEVTTSGRFNTNKE